MTAYKMLPVIAVCSVLTVPSRAAIVVEDLANLVQNVNTSLNTAKTYIQSQLAWATQIKQLATETASYVTEGQMLLSFVHNPSLGAATFLLGQAGLDTSLPMSAMSMFSLANGYGAMAGGGGFNLGQVAGVLNSIGSFGGITYNQNHIYSPTDGSRASLDLNTNASTIAGTQAAAMAAYDDTQHQDATLKALREQGKAAGNPLDMAAVGVQGGVLTNWYLAQQTKLQALKITADEQDKARTQRDAEAVQKGWQKQMDEARTAGVPGL